ncbi:N-6 DNA methylase [Gordonia sp. ABSL1-1]|uniref:Eco57I restriction-modification methylase domain-containing protein n=1 Tax=Gordonia sp. ABSL1-1 TaxID=3053923 RepID=UPI002573F401|nr:N-6 DNA methylase [Gordonia sp. ABSL1-1]MDL9938905.1 N-6 DNA methylase [Gordonia sp. ABSL1-1]
MLPGDTTALRKARGAFFTPPLVAQFLVDWAVRAQTDAILEPSCGEAVFLHAAGLSGHRGRLVGVELHRASANEAQRTLRREGIATEIHVGDFFDHDEYETFDAVVGNPPYVRYQDFTGDARTRARQAALRGGVTLTNLASSWAAFTVQSALHLKAGGRLALVLPAELLTVNYAAGVRRFLMERFNSVELVLFEERVFPGVQEEVVLLLADGYSPNRDGGTDHMTMRPVRNPAELATSSATRRWTPPDKAAKWSAGLLSAEGLEIYSAAVTGSEFTPLETWGDTTLGMVTGNNRFFTLTPAKADDLDLDADDVISLSPPGSRHLRHLSLTARRLSTLGDDGAATLLFRPAGEPSASAWRYIESGEALDVHGAYKCRVRSPWWRVPYLRPADLFLTYMNADTPRIASNLAGTHHLNSVHGIYLRRGLKSDGTSLLPVASLNSLTLVGAETVGRAYGGGMLKVEPREADLLPMPSPDLVQRHKTDLQAIRPTVAAALRRGDLLGAVALVDDVLLTSGMRLTRKQIAALRRDHADLTARRMARSKESPSTKEIPGGGH